jgi:transposase
VIRGILMMCIASVFFSAMHVTVRYISRDLPPMQIAFLRNIFGVIVFLPLLYLRGFAFLRTGRLGLYVVRGLVDAGAMLMFFTGLALVSVARVRATHFLMKRLKNVRTEMALSVLAYNLTRVMNILGIGPLIAAIRA